MKTHRTLNKIALFISHISVPAENLYKSWLVLSIVILTLPVYLGCSKSEHPQDGDFTEDTIISSVKPAVHKRSESQMLELDALVFNDDQMQRLDCYQHLAWDGMENVLIGSCGGKKILLLCASLNVEKDFWKQYNSYRKALSLEARLEDEDPHRPVLSACARINAGDEAEIDMGRISSEVVLRSIRCDFSGKPYAGESITEAKAYLTNLNATCSLIPQGDDQMKRIINHKGLVQQDLRLFRDSTMIFREIGNIGTEGLRPSAGFICYPNNAKEETIGTPFTRLVIEGKIMGETWFWPIDINRGPDASFPEGISRDSRYVFDVTIRSKGTKDPDTPVTHTMLETVFEVDEWKEKEEYAVGF